MTLGVRGKRGGSDIGSEKTMEVVVVALAVRGLW